MRYRPEEDQLNRICYNIIVSSMIKNYGIYDIESLYILIFKHLIYSKGLNLLLSYSRYEQEKNQWRRNDDYLLEIATQIYMESSN